MDAARHETLNLKFLLRDNFPQTAPDVCCDYPEDVSDLLDVIIRLDESYIKTNKVNVAIIQTLGCLQPSVGIKLIKLSHHPSCPATMTGDVLDLLVISIRLNTSYIIYIYIYSSPSKRCGFTGFVGAGRLQGNALQLLWSEPAAAIEPRTLLGSPFSGLPSC